MSPAELAAADKLVRQLAWMVRHDDELMEVHNFDRRGLIKPVALKLLDLTSEAEE